MHKLCALILFTYRLYIRNSFKQKQFFVESNSTQCLLVRSPTPCSVSQRGVGLRAVLVNFGLKKNFQNISKNQLIDSWRYWVSKYLV